MKEKNKKVREVVIFRVLEITPGGRNAWVETNIGRLKKPLKGISEKFLKEFEEKKERERSMS